MFQAGINRLAHHSAKLLYHCKGNNGLTKDLFIQSCGSDLENLSQSCIEKLNKQVESSVLETEKYFNNYKKYGALNLFELLMQQEDYEHWFETSNFCKKREIFFPKDLLENNVVTEIF